jgi:hypothetical protein
VASRNHWNTIGSGTPEKSHSAYPCEVAGGSSSAEPWDDSSLAEALGSSAARTWWLGQALRTTTSVLAEATYAVVALRRPTGKRGPETERSPTGAAVVSPEGMPALRPRLSRAQAGASAATWRQRTRSICAGRC